MACLIAFPLAYWVMHQWLLDFAYRIPMSPWMFIIAGGIALVIALGTVSMQSIRAALQNPVKSLKSE